MIADYTFPVIELRMRHFADQSTAYDIIEKDAMDFEVTLNLDFSMDEAKFSLSNSEGEATYKYEKFDQFEIWAGYNEPTTHLFKGMLTKIKPVSGTGGNLIQYIGQNMGALLNFLPAKKSISYSERDIRMLIERVLDWNDIVYNNPASVYTSKINPNIPLHLELSPQSGDTIGQVLQKIKEKTAYEMWIDYEGAINVEPLSILMARQKEAVKLEYGINLKDCEAPDLTERYNRVEVYGLHPDMIYAIAEDKVMIAQSMGQVRTYVLRDRSITDQATCLKVAQEKLLELNKNFKITATTIFLPTIRQGDCVYLYNPYLALEGFFTVQSVTHTIKGGQADTKLELFAGIVNRIPKDSVVKSTLSIATVWRRNQ